MFFELFSAFIAVPTEWKCTCLSILFVFDYRSYWIINIRYKTFRFRVAYKSFRVSIQTIIDEKCRQSCKYNCFIRKYLFRC